MASVKKFSAGAVRNQLRHNEREIAKSSNPDIDPERQCYDYKLSPDRGMTDYDYFLQRKSELYCYGREDVKVMAGWIVTAPQDLAEEREHQFFETVFVSSRPLRTPSMSRVIKSVQMKYSLAVSCVIFTRICNAILTHTVWTMPVS